VHARRIRPDTGHLDRRRLASAGLSAILPGLGQLVNRRRQLATIFLAPTLVLLAIGGILVATQSPARLVAWVASPTVLGIVLSINLLVLVLRLLAVVQAFLDTRWHGPTGRAGIVGLALIVVLVVLPHGIAYRYGTALGDTFASVFQDGAAGVGDGPAAEPPSPDERVNVLLIGVDTLPWRTATLTDTMMVVSLDPVGRTVSMLSLPRDLINVPLGNGDVFGPKLNSLMSYAASHEDEFPQGGVQALLDATGALLGIEIPYYARIDFYGFVEMVDTVGGVDVVVAEPIEDPEYAGFKLDKRGWSITAGPHHLDGANALAYARARKALGESDFTRAARQQQILIALRDAVTRDGSLLWELPALLETVGRRVRSNVPISQLPELAAIVDEVEDGAITRAVIRHPLVRSESTRYGSSLVPDVAAIQAVAAALFPEPGSTPEPWPTPEPSTGSPSTGSPSTGSPSTGSPSTGP
jgi:polyisoprenyl-teichoic acid--peptidoglycan teichoic acid transferase